LVFWNDSDGNGVLDRTNVSRQDLAKLRGFKCRTVPSVNTFYEMVAYLWPVDTAENPWEDSNIRQLRWDMDHVIEEKIKQSRAMNPDPTELVDAIRHLEDVKATFNASCDMVRDEAGEMEIYGGNEYQDWCHFA
jgi:hypothetical protein